MQINQTTHYKLLWLQIRPTPAEQSHILKATVSLQIKYDRPSKAEIKSAVNQLKSGKAARTDNFPPEALKIDPNLSDMLYGFFGRIWEEEKTEWAEGCIIKLRKKGDLGKCNSY